MIDQVAVRDPLPCPEATPMLFVDCPLCDAATPLDAEAAAIDCPACGVHLELAADSPATRAAHAPALPVAA